MNENILTSCEPVIILGGGAIGAEDLPLALLHAKRVVAADGGANVADAFGLTPDAIIGDLDSIDPIVRAQADPDRVFHIAEQDSTDFDKAMRHIQAPCLLAVGFSGRRMDHQMGALHTMVARAHQTCILLAAEDVVFVCPRKMTLALAVGTRFSLFPMGAVQGRSTGLKWPVDGIDFAPGLRSGTSNEALGPVSLEMDAPNMLCFLPRDCLDLALRALVALPSSARWTARGAQYRDPQPS